MIEEDKEIGRMKSFSKLNISCNILLSVFFSHTGIVHNWQLGGNFNDFC